ncbi:hypothetical protein P7K49_009100 [Saguinus oedipus]|uniref:Uncharacterized protein n=1 Tax=Saguinus oedipus TaxID=9490 RepID=A0ABQ9W1B6_SAGOE|nr:hypothetical protein P7K49_009100 [Saguinus oedipus]
MKSTCGFLVAMSASNTRDLLSPCGYSVTLQTMGVDEEETAFSGAQWEGIKVLPSRVEDTPALRRAKYSKAQPRGVRNSHLQQGQKIRKRHHLNLVTLDRSPRVWVWRLQQLQLSLHPLVSEWLPSDLGFHGPLFENRWSPQALWREQLFLGELKLPLLLAVLFLQLSQVSVS